jgi:hypothetical protein
MAACKVLLSSIQIIEKYALQPMLFATVCMPHAPKLPKFLEVLYASTVLDLVGILEILQNQ